MFGGTLGDGVDVREMRAAIPVVSESVRRMIHDYLSGREVLVTGPRAHLDIFAPITKDEQAAAEAIAEETRVTPLLHKPFGVMSTGERQRILLTRALLSNPRVIVLDEPCSGLDLAGREWVLHTIESISRRPDAPALLLTTHHVEEIAEGFTHALLLKQGKVFAAGTIDEVFTASSLSNQFDLPLEISHHNGRWSARAVT
jgi:iron complex transport system ATP-binding protein